MAQIIPAILATTEEEYKNKLQKITNSNQFDWVQIDLMDSKFVQNQSIKLYIMAKYPTNLKIEAHLMVEYPENWIDELVKIPVQRIIFPVEDTEGIKERIEHIKNHGIEVGLSINPETPVTEIEPYLNLVDVVLIMSVRPGFGWQEFIPETIGKIKELNSRRSLSRAQSRDSGHIQFKIECDGGINEKNAKLVIDAGADLIVVGSYLLESNINENLEKILETQRPAQG